MVIIVMGVSGSGKTAVGEALAAGLNWLFEDADNWHPASSVEKMHKGEALTDEDRQPWLRALNSAILAWIAEKRDVVLACSALSRCVSCTSREPMRRLTADLAVGWGTSCRDRFWKVNLRC